MVFAPHAEPSQIIKETIGYTHFWEASIFAKRNFHEILLNFIKTEITKKISFGMKH